jgi:hypothetical protein
MPGTRDFIEIQHRFTAAERNFIGMMFSNKLVTASRVQPFLAIAQRNYAREVLSGRSSGSSHIAGDACVALLKVFDEDPSPVFIPMMDYSPM